MMSLRLQQIQSQQLRWRSSCPVVVPSVAQRNAFCRRHKSSTSTTSSARTKSTAASATATATAAAPELGLMRGMWQRYTEALIQHPLLVKGSTASLIFFVSDSVTQYLTEPVEAPFHWGRACSGAAFGVVATSWLHYWWGFLETAVGRRLPVAQHRLANTMTKVVIDQAIGAPIYIFTYYCITHFGKEYLSQPTQSLSSSSSSIGENPSLSGVVTRHSETSKSAYQLWTETYQRAAEMLPPTMLRHWTLWPLVHSINFHYFSLHHRVLVQNLVLVGWSGYLSHLNNGGLHGHGQLMTPEEEVEIVAEETFRRRDSLRQIEESSRKASAPSRS